MSEDSSEQFPKVIAFSEASAEIVKKIKLSIYPDFNLYTEKELKHISLDEYLKIIHNRIPEKEVNGKIRTMIDSLPTEIIAWMALSEDNNICLKTLRRRLQNKKVSTLTELIHIAIMAHPNEGCSKRKRFSTLNKIHKQLFEMMPGLASEASDEEIVAISKDLLYINARDLQWWIIYMLMNCQNPWGDIYAQTKNFSYGSINFNFVWKEVKQDRPPES